MPESNLIPNKTFLMGLVWLLRGAQRKQRASVVHIWPNPRLQKYLRGFCLGSEISFRLCIA